MYTKSRAEQTVHSRQIKALSVHWQPLKKCPSSVVCQQGNVLSVGKSLTIVLLPNCVKENGGFFLFTPFEHDTQKLLIEARLLVY